MAITEIERTELAGAPDLGEATSALAAAPALGREFFRYFLASVLALGVDFGLLIGLTELVGLNYLVSAAIGFLTGMGVAYALSVRWVFGERRLAGNGGLEAGLFFVIGILGLGLNLAILWLVRDVLHEPYTAGKVLSAGLVFAWNFAARKLVLFHSARSTRSLNSF